MKKGSPYSREMHLLDYNVCILKRFRTDLMLHEIEVQEQIAELSMLIQFLKSAKKKQKVFERQGFSDEKLKLYGLSLIHI